MGGYWSRVLASTGASAQRPAASQVPLAALLEESVPLYHLPDPHCLPYRSSRGTSSPPPRAATAASSGSNLRKPLASRGGHRPEETAPPLPSSLAARPPLPSTPLSPTPTCCVSHAALWQPRRSSERTARPGAQVLVKRQLSPPVMAAALRIRPVLFLAGERARGTALCIRHRSCAAGQGFAAPSQGARHQARPALSYRFN